jgi:hypothetical protein
MAPLPAAGFPGGAVADLSHRPGSSLKARGDIASVNVRVATLASGELPCPVRLSTVAPGNSLVTDERKSNVRKQLFICGGGTAKTSQLCHDGRLAGVL